MILKGSGNYTGAFFQILPTTSDVSMIAVETSFGLPYGNLFQSASNDPNYWTSLRNIRMVDSGLPDFYKTDDLNGIYMANVFSDEYVGGAQEDSHTHTMITFDNGGLWNTVLTEDDQELHLFLTTEYVHAKPHSNENAVGIIYSLGNLGTVAEPSIDDVDLYLSRSAGYRWVKVLEGSHFFNFNDHASLIIAMSGPDVTGIVKYSWDQGITWDECTWGDSFYVRQIYALTNYPNGLQFLVLGEYENGEGTVLSLDFMNAIPRICGEDDFEVFQPTVGGVCLLGQSTSYVRRKRDTTCVSSDVIQQQEENYSCECVRHDYQW